MATKIEKPMFGGNCPRCGQLRTTFDIFAAKQTEYSTWPSYEAFLVCRNCFRSSIALFKSEGKGVDDPMSMQGNFINEFFDFRNWVFEIPNRRHTPQFVPSEIDRIFQEGATCAAIGAFDAAGTMFRKVLDAATRGITPRPDSEKTVKPASWKVYKDLRLRLDWLFDQGLLSPALKDLSSCIHEDVNDAAHALDGINDAEAQDLGDFCERVLETLYTVPGQIGENRRRRDERRGVEVAS